MSNEKNIVSKSLTKWQSILEIAVSVKMCMNSKLFFVVWEISIKEKALTDWKEIRDVVPSFSGPCEESVPIFLISKPFSKGDGKFMLAYGNGLMFHAIKIMVIIF